MIAEKRHIGLLVFDDNKHKTPVANVRTEALRWWDAIPKEAKKQVLSEHGFDSDGVESLGWSDLVTVYRSVHHRSDAEGWWNNLSSQKQREIIRIYGLNSELRAMASWVRTVRLFFLTHEII